MTAERHPTGALLDAGSLERDTESVPGRAPVRILHVIIMLGETNSQYNEHCLPSRRVHDLTICTYFRPRLTSPPEIDVVPGDGTLRGFFRAFGEALAAKTYDVIHVHAPQTGALVTLALISRPGRLRLRRALVYTVHDSFQDYTLRDKLLMLPSLATSRRVVYCGRAAQDSYPGPWRRLVGKRGRVVQNGADLDRVERATGPLTRTEDASVFRLVSVGRLENVKDPLTLLAAFRRLEDTRSRLTFVGTGCLEAELGRTIEAWSLQERAELTGLIPRDEVFARCAQADLFVSSSRGEGLPVAVIEAMATGCPVVLSDIPPHRELADGVEFVPLVRLGDSEGFAREIARFVGMSSEARKAIGLRCRELARASFGLPAMHAGYDQVYCEVLA